MCRKLMCRSRLIMVCATLLTLHETLFAGEYELDLLLGSDLSWASPALVDQNEDRQQSMAALESVESARVGSRPEVLPIVGARLVMPLPTVGGRTSILELGSSTASLALGVQFELRTRNIESDMLIRDPEYRLDRELSQRCVVRLGTLAFPVSVGYWPNESLRLSTGLTVAVPIPSVSSVEMSSDDKVYANGSRAARIETPRITESGSLDDLVHPVSLGWDLGLSWQPGYTFVFDTAIGYRSNPLDSSQLDLGGWSIRFLLGYHFVL